MYTSSIYKKSPIILQNVFVSLRDLVRGFIRGDYKAAALLARIIKNEYSQRHLSDYTAVELNKVLSNAKMVPAYNGGHTRLQDFDYIDKLAVKSNLKHYLNHSKNNFITVSGSTSGTTGMPLSIPQTLESVIREQAFVSRHLEWAGYKKGDRRAWIRGDMVVSMTQKNAPFWRYSWFENMILLSSFHLTKNSIPQYLDAMIEFGVDIIQAYPSSIVIIAKYLKSKNLFYKGKLKSVVTSSESLSVEDRQLIESRFRCKIFDWYGLFERVAAIANCEHGRYHIISDYSHVEFLDAGDGRHEIVGTNFNNSLCILVRYRTSDYVIISKEQSCPCGRVYPLVEKIEGRVGDYLLGEDGQKVYVLNHIPKGIDGLLGCQFLQSNKTEIEVLVVIDSEIFGSVQEDKLINNTKARVGHKIKVNVKRVDSLLRTRSGKVRQAVCSIKE